MTEVVSNQEVLTEVRSLRQKIIQLQVEISRLDLKVAEHVKLRWDHIEELSTKVLELENVIRHKGQSLF